MPPAALRRPPHTGPRSRWWVSVAAWGLWVVAVWGLIAGLVVIDRLLRQTGGRFLTTFAVAPTLACLSAATVGAVVATRRPRHPVGWLLLALGVSLTLSGVVAGAVEYGVASGIMATPGMRVATRWYPATVDWAFGLLGFILLLTPTGTPPMPRWRWWAGGAAVAPVILAPAMLVLPHLQVRSAAVDNPFDFRSFYGPLLAANRAGLAVALLTVLGGVVALVTRFRHARGVEHQQLRWVALAAGLTAGCIVAVAAFSAAGMVGLVGWAGSIAVVIMPPTIGASILRYRLYDVDRIVSRVVPYGALTLVLAALYSVAVVVPAQVLGRRSSIAVAIATLTVAAAFRPLQRRIRTAVDHRFNRRRYDAEATVHGFSTVLREEPDLTVVRSVLSSVVYDTMQPTQLSVWVADPSLRSSASW